MALAMAEPQRPRMSGTAFRAFQHTRPDHERWELIAGAAVMMTPPTMEHNRIASNLETVLNRSLARHDPALIAVQRPGIEFGWPPEIVKELGLHGEYRPEPDIAVVDYEDMVAGRRFTRSAYLVAEVVSSTDQDHDRRGGERWIDTKVRLYQAHAPCRAIVLVEQERIFVTLLVRSESGWLRSDVINADTELVVASLGFSCGVGDIYADTRWRPRRSER